MASKEKLKRLQEKRDKLNSRIKQGSARLQAKAGKERNARLIQWGMVVEGMLKNGAMSLDQLNPACRRYLQGRSMERALTGPLSDYAANPDQEQGKQ